ncbi:MAG: heavy metal translocating P-type ATPase [Cyanobacteria bacterium P01_D01_bin.105]
MTRTVTPSATPNAASEHTSNDVDALKADHPEENQAVTTTAAQTVVLDVEGMMCAGCVSTVEKKLAQCDGVNRATVNLVTEVAAVECAPEADLEVIAQTLTAAGFPSKIRTNTVSNALSAESDWISRKEAAQQHQIRQLTTALILLTLSTLGHLQHAVGYFTTFVSGSISWPLMSWAGSLSIPILSTLWFHGVLATLTLLFPARQIIVEGTQGLRRGSPNMNTLVALGALSAYLTSLAALVFPSLGWACFFDEPVMLLSFILLGRTLEQRARFQAASSLRSLIALQPTLARLVPNPSTASAETTGVQIPVAQVQRGEWVRVLPSEKVPMDGVIAQGQTTIDESMLTGESVPVVKQVGSEVVAGSLNQSGAVTVQVTRTGNETALAQMIHLIETAQTRKAPIQGFADLIAGYFTYGVLACALLTFGFWYFVGVPVWPEAATIAMGHAHHVVDAPFVDAPVGDAVSTAMQGTAMPNSMLAHAENLRLLASLKLAIAVLVVACPCALGLATPTAILVGSGIGAKQGLLIRGGDILESARALDTIVFDKTGTLTTGKPQLTDSIVINPAFSVQQLLQLSATVESRTHHPIGLAIEQAASQQMLDLLDADEFYTEAGFGITAQVTLPNGNRARCLVGNSAWMERHHCSSSEALAHAQALGAAGKTAVWVAVDQQVVGIFGIADTLRKDAVETIAALRSLGLNVHILSGDSVGAASAIAQQLNISLSQVQAKVTPQAKVNAISKLQKAGHHVGLVGDGINDAPALVQADVGIALNAGTDIAMETADIVLMRNALTDIPAAIALSQATFNKIRQNLAWAFTYNLICIPLAAGALLPTLRLSLNPGFAGALMAFSSVSVVINSLLLKRAK